MCLNSSSLIQANIIVVRDCWSQAVVTRDINLLSKGVGTQFNTPAHDILALIARRHNSLFLLYDLAPVIYFICIDLELICLANTLLFQKTKWYLSRYFANKRNLIVN